ncbi:MAG TPA: zinc ribbon domain-containing protein [Nitrosopumilaceae archaeon]|nr:zinc ribbon domain-containing protein [Nitrosopumilaceae archaeon]
MSEDSQDNGEKKDRFYEPKNWDRKLTIAGDTRQSPNIYCGKCGHIIIKGDKFCTKCGAESKA